MIPSGASRQGANTLDAPRSAGARCGAHPDRPEIDDCDLAKHPRRGRAGVLLAIAIPIILLLIALAIGPFGRDEDSGETSVVPRPRELLEPDEGKAPILVRPEPERSQPDHVGQSRVEEGVEEVSIGEQSEDSRPLEKPEVDFAERYANSSYEELVVAREAVTTKLQLMAERLQQERYDQGLVEIRDGTWDPEIGGYVFHTGGKEPYTQLRGIPGVFDQMEAVVLPVDEYPELYQLEAERDWLAKKTYPVQLKGGQESP